MDHQAILEEMEIQDHIQATAMETSHIKEIMLTIIIQILLLPKGN